MFEGLEVVQESEETNMLDYQAVQDIAIRMGYPETAMWVREHRVGPALPHIHRLDQH